MPGLTFGSQRNIRKTIMQKEWAKEKGQKKETVNNLYGWHHFKSGTTFNDEKNKKGKSSKMQAYADRKFRRDRNTQQDAQSEVERGFRMGIQVHIMQ